MTRIVRLFGLIALLAMLGLAPASAQQNGGFEVSTTRPSDAKDCITQYGLPTREQIRHPSVYQESGIDDNTLENVCVFVRSDFTLIVVGFEVNGMGDGVYAALDVEQDSYVVVNHVTDGFIAVVWDDWAKDELTFRLDQAVEFNWAHEVILVPASWESDFQQYGQ